MEQRQTWTDVPVVCVRGPSRSGKSTLCSAIIPMLAATGIRTAYVKRTHHELDLPGKASARVWSAGAAAMAIRAPDRLQLTLPPGPEDVGSLLRQLPPDTDLVLLETHTQEPYPTILSRCIEPEPDEQVVARWAIPTFERDLIAAVAAIDEVLTRRDDVHSLVAEAARFHGGHACPGIVLGTRLAVEGARQLDIAIPDRCKRLLVVLETQRCAADAVQAITGCRPGRRTLQFRDYGKLAATFVDVPGGRAIRVAARADLRERARAFGEPGEDVQRAQRRAYLALPADQLFSIEAVPFALDPFDRPGPPSRRVNCADCGEEVSDGREVVLAAGSLCRPCAAQSPAPNRRFVA